MAENKKSPPKGVSKVKAGLLWGAAQWAFDWFVLDWFEIQSGGLGSSVGAALGGFAAGWIVTGILNTLARWKVPGKALFVLGAILGVAVVSGAVKGLSALFNWFSTKSFDIDLEKLQAFVLSPNVVPALVLGALTGLIAGRKPAGKK